MYSGCIVYSYTSVSSVIHLHTLLEGRRGSLVGGLVSRPEFMQVAVAFSKLLSKARQPSILTADVLKSTNREDCEAPWEVTNDLSKSIFLLFFFRNVRMELFTKKTSAKFMGNFFPTEVSHQFSSSKGFVMCHFFPDAALYAHHVFTAFDLNRSGSITFKVSL